MSTPTHAKTRTLTGADGEGAGLPKERPSRRALAMPVLVQGPRAGEVPAAPASTVPPGPCGSLHENCPVAIVPASLQCQLTVKLQAGLF